MNQFDLIANHLANADSAGFKRDILSFDGMLAARLTTDLSQGDLKYTGNRLDLALGDEGFFKVQTPAGVRYTRAGQFTTDADGFLVTGNGDPVLGAAGPIAVNGATVTVNEIGEIEVDGEIVDTFDIVTFEDLGGLRKEGASLFAYDGDPADEIPPARVSVKQGALEGPNFSVAAEMTHMIETLRMYESFQKVIQTFDETDSKTITEVGRPI